MAQTGLDSGRRRAEQPHIRAGKQGRRGGPQRPSICEVTACATGQSQRVWSRAVAGAAAGAPDGQRHGLQRPPGRQLIAARQRTLRP
eukprot:136050-Chlamydomonas_euryale.AAC.1